ncbi:MAG TPA: transcriptional regulator [Deltaproteobacteria bacterium]|nr:transcriptional regulator [Deltaproteobacteria bacterium]
MSLLRQSLHMLGKELLTEWRQRSRISGVFWFAFAIVLMVGFATPNSGVLADVSAGTLWLGLLLASTRSLDQSYAVEHEHGAMEGLMLWPVDPIAIFYGKAVANALVLILVALVLLPLVIAIFGADVRGSPAQLLAVIVLGCAALAAPGTLYGLITSQARGSAVLLPLLMFPVVVPALLASSNATMKVFEGDPMEQVPAWLTVLAVFNLVQWSLGGGFYGWLLED